MALCSIDKGLPRDDAFPQMPDATIPGSRLERRERQRFPVRLTLDVKSGEGEPRRAVSRDASECGISFYCDDPIPAGSSIEFNVHVPEEVAEVERIRVRGKGTVVRNETQSSGRILVAVVTNRYELNDSH